MNYESNFRNHAGITNFQKIAKKDQISFSSCEKLGCRLRKSTIDSNNENNNNKNIVIMARIMI